MDTDRKIVGLQVVVGDLGSIGRPDTNDYAQEVGGRRAGIRDIQVEMSGEGDQDVHCGRALRSHAANPLLEVPAEDPSMGVMPRDVTRAYF